MADAATIRQGLIQRGIPEHIADGFVLNFQDESGLNPAINERNPIVRGSRGGYGLAQWTGPRRVAYEQFAAQNGVSPDSVDAQLDFVVNELGGTERRAANNIYASTNRGEAATAIARDYLRPAPQYLQSRVARYQNAGPVDVAPNGEEWDDSPAPTVDLAPNGEEWDDTLAPTQSSQDIPQQASLTPQQRIEQGFEGQTQRAPTWEAGSLDRARQELGERLTASELPGINQVNALGQGFYANFLDELGGGVNAVGETIAKAATGRFDEINPADDYARKADAINDRTSRFSASNPVQSTALQVGGAIASAPFTPGLGGANAAVRAARTGTAYGAVAGLGAGEGGADSRIDSAVEGAVLGNVAGRAGNRVVQGLAGGAGAVGRAVSAPFRGAVNTENEAARRVAQAFGGVEGLERGAVNLEEAAIQGVPLVAADVGGEQGRALARSVANTSPEARQSLQSITQDRFEGQNERVSNFIQDLTGATGDTGLRRLQLQESARTANRPAYAKAYREGNIPIWDDTTQQIASAPVVQDAIREATRTSANRGAVQGDSPMANPFTIRGGQISLSGKAQPSLQFWDNVSRNLNDAYSAANRAGRNSEASDILQLKNALQSHLDEIVPSFREARAGAAQAFGAQDALEAGQGFVRSNMPLPDARRAFSKLSQPEKELFKDGFLNNLIEQINSTSDKRNVLNSIFLSSPNARNKISLVLGDDGATKLEGFLRLENLQNLTRQAISGNSTTARQLAELGIATGVGAGINYNNPFSAQTAITGALLYGARRGQVKINDRVIRQVGELLSSNDPASLRRVQQLVAKNKTLLDAVRQAESAIAEISSRSVNQNDDPNQTNQPILRGQ